MYMKRRTYKIFIFLIIAIVSLFASCEWIKGFFPASFGPEYYDSGTNYIKDLPFNTPKAAAEASDVNFPWDWAWRGKTANSFEYMSMKEEAGVLTPDGKQAWRLELVNLAIDPHFNDAPIPVSFDASNDPKAFINTDTAIHGNSYKLDTNTNSNSYIKIMLNTLLSDAPQNNFSYFLRLLKEPSTTLNYGMFYSSSDSMDNVLSLNPFLPATDTAGSLFFPDKISSRGSEFGIYIIHRQSFNIDEMRIVRDIDPRLVLYLKETDTSPSLVPGQYEFSLWVKMPDDAKVYWDKGRDIEPYASEYISLGITQVNGENRTPIHTNSKYFTVSNAWQRIFIRTQEPNNIDSFEHSDYPVLMLSIAPTRTDNRIDAGAVLIAAPELNFYINGF